MKLFQRTTTEAAVRVLSNGFRDGEGYDMTTREEEGDPWRGVWLCDRPFVYRADRLPPGQGVLLSISMPDDVVGKWERIEEEKPYRQFVVPSDIVNRYGPPEILDEGSR